MNWTLIIANLLFLAGLAAIVVGAWLLMPAAAWIVGGIGLILMAVGLLRSATAAQNEQGR